MADRSLTDPDFAPVFRGYDRVQVDGYVREVRSRLLDLEAEVARLVDSVSETAIHPVPEYERIGREVGELLTEADRVATGIRERAAAEVEEWRNAASAEVKAITAAAAADAEALRGDAWSTSSELLAESQARAADLVAEAETTARGIRAEAEREAHRLVAGARREADEQIRVAKMEAERLVAEALAEKDEIVERARKTAEAAQERARALEVRRDELLGELEAVRATVQRLETDIEEKRQQLEPDPEPAPASQEPTWGDGVRIIPAREDRGPVEELGEPVETMAVVEEVMRLREPEAGAGHVAIIEAEPVEPEDVGEPEAARSSETESGPPPELVLTEDEVSATVSSTPADDDDVPVDGDELTDLFRSLRGSDADPTTIKPETPSAPEPGESSPPMTPRSPVVTGEMVEHLQQVLIPITNGALRAVKRELADAQNRALETLRLEEEWKPSQAELTKQFGRLLDTVRDAAYAAGWRSVASNAEVHGNPGNDRTTFVGDLVATLLRALDKASDATSAATEVSRAFRAWRADSAERHLRGVATIAFNEGVAAALHARGDEPRLAVRERGCSSCRAASEQPVDQLPPLHADCTCMVVGTQVSAE